MQSVNEKNEYNRVLRKTCFSTDVIYLSLHLVYMIFFIISKAYIMIGINCVSILVYLLTFLLLRKDKFYAYAIVCGNEYFVFMSFATVLFGFAAGFQLTIIGLSTVAFFAAYFSPSQKTKSAVEWSVLSVILYLGLHFYCSFHDPYYELAKWLTVTLYAMHAVIAFTFIAAYLLIFIKYATRLEKRILNESRIDYLTQIHNRNDLYNYLESIDNLDDYVLAIFDIDDFKKINDIYGHICGDFILKEVADIATKTLDKSFVSRFGGEEFIIITKKSDNYDEIVEYLDVFRKVIEAHNFTYNGVDISLTITIGVKEHKGSISPEEWINLADEKMYSGKNSGKNKTVK